MALLTGFGFKLKKQFDRIHFSNKQKLSHKQRLCLTTCTLMIFASNTAFAADTNSPLTKPQISAAKRGNSYAKSSKADKAQAAYQPAIDQAVSVEQCLALVKNTEHFGSVLVPVRRNCLNKALHLAKTQDEYFEIISSARQCQLYEITKEAIDSLIAKADTQEDLLTLAHKAQTMGLNDVGHIAMQKLYTKADTMDDKVAFAKQAKLMAMEDLMRQAIKDAMDEQNGAHNLCYLISAIEPLEQQDLQRKILRKAVYQVESPEDCKEVFDMAKRLGQQDIVELSAYKGRKMLLIRQAQTEQSELNDREEAARRESEAAQNQTPASVENKTPAPTGPGF